MTKIELLKEFAKGWSGNSQQHSIHAQLLKARGLGKLASLLKRLEKQRYLTCTRLDGNERKLFLALTDEGEALKDRAISVPEEM